MFPLIAVDIGGTHARFARAEIAEGRVVQLAEVVTLKTAEHDGLPAAWKAYCTLSANRPPRAAAIAVAGPVDGGPIRFTNNSWTIRPDLLRDELGVDALTLVNDFEAIGHAVAQAGEEHFLHLCGPDGPLPASGTISIVGPGTGLGVGHVRRSGRSYHVQATEGGHVSFAPQDDVEDAILAHLRHRHGRVSAERVVSGPGLVEIHAVLAQMSGHPAEMPDDIALWALALSGDSGLASVALERFCLALGTVSGDVALAQGGSAVVIAGGLGLRIRDRLVDSGFAARFQAKGRFAPYMAKLPVKLITHPEPGLFGAAAAFGRNRQ